MTILKAEKRNLEIKAKKLRREGFTTGILFGKDAGESIPIQFPNKEAISFVKNNKAGAQVVLDIDGRKTSAIVKSIDYDFMKRQILALDCQALIAGEKISTAAQIKFMNEDIVQGVVEPALSEILYKAEPANLLDTIEIDFEKLSPEVKIMYVKDLELSQKKGVELITPEDALVFHIGTPANITDVEDDAAAEAEPSDGESDKQ